MRSASDSPRAPRLAKGGKDRDNALFHATKIWYHALMPFTSFFVFSDDLLADMILSSRRFLLRVTRLAAVFCCAACLPDAAHAALVYCNRTQQPIEAALGYRGPLVDGISSWVSEGWWRIEPGQCSRVFGQQLKQRFYFYYAIAKASSGPDRQPFVWSGKFRFCTDTKAFRIEGDEDCEGRGYLARGFQQLDIGTNIHDYTLDFRDSGP